MSFIAAITDAGIAAAENAPGPSFQINIDHALFSSNLLTPTVAFLQTVTSFTNITYTAPTNEISYHIINSNTIMLRVNLPPNIGPFNFGCYALCLDDGTLFAVGTWTTLQTKDVNAARYVELTIQFSNAAATINLTILNTIDAALPEVPDETFLPAAVSAPYPVYYVNQLIGYENRPALASRLGGTWYYYPQLQSFYVPDTGSVNAMVGTSATAIAPTFSNLAHIKSAIYIRAANTNTGLVTFNLDGLGAFAVVNMDGSNMVPGQIAAESIIAVVYDANINKWQLLTPLPKPSRVRLMGPLNLFVNTNGNDSNDGLSSGTPFLHLQTAWNYITNNIDANGNSIQVNCANGSGPFTVGVFASTPPIGGATGINFYGDPATPSNVQVNVSSGDCFVAIGGVIYQVEGFRLSASTTGGPYIGGGSGTAVSGGGLMYIKNDDFNTCVAAHIDAEGGTITSLGRYYSISGDAGAHAFASTAGQVGTAISMVLITGTPTFSGAFAICEFNSVVSLWDQYWGNPQIIGVKVNNPGSTLTNGTRTFTAAGGFGTDVCTWTATVAGGTVTGGITITDNGAYSVFAMVPTVTISSGNVLTFTSTTGVYDGMIVNHLNIPHGTTVLSHTLTTVTMSAGVTGAIQNLDDYVSFYGDPVLEANAATVDTGTTDATWDLAVAHGSHFSVTYSSVINVQGASLKYLPGDIASTPDTAHGGYYA